MSAHVGPNPLLLMRWLPSSRVASAPAGATDDSEPLTAAQIAAWRSSGVVVLRPGLLPLTLLADVRRDALRSFGAPGRADDALAFPSTASTAANVVTLHPRLLRAAAQLLGVPTLSLRLTQSVRTRALQVSAPSVVSFSGMTCSVACGCAARVGQAWRGPTQP